jgi:hypothetical protein
MAGIFSSGAFACLASGRTETCARRIAMRRIIGVLITIATLLLAAGANKSWL